MVAVRLALHDDVERMDRKGRLNVPGCGEEGWLQWRGEAVGRSKREDEQACKLVIVSFRSPFLLV